MEQFTLHEHQVKVLNSNARFIGCIAGIRGGKTTIGAVWLLRQIDQDRESGKCGDYLICAPTNKILDQSTLPKFKEFFPPDWGVWKEQKSYFELKWNRPGSNEPCRIFVRSMDEPDSVEGMDCLAAWMDEVGKMKSQAWINVQGRLSVNKGKCILTTTPYAVNWFYKDIYKKNGDPDYDIIVWSSIDNPAFPHDEYERAKRTLPHAIFEKRYHAKFTRLEGLVYPEFDDDLHIVEPFDIPDKWLRFGGLDFGHSNPNAIICIAQDPEANVFYVYKEYYRSETMLKNISDFLHREGLAYVLADSQSAQLIAELNQFYGNRNVKDADKKIEVGVERVRGLLIEKRLKFFRDRCQNTIDEIEQYHYASGTDDRAASEKPVAKDNHAMDALRYAFSRPIQGLYSNRPSFNKQKLYSWKRRRLLEDVNELTGY
jgi:PBSX family phage terminase large subunit